MANLLITGGAGFIGANFVHHWLREHPGDRVIVLDALTYAGNLASLEPVKANPGFAFVHGDIRTPGLAERLLREHDVTLLVHFAAESHVDRSIVGPDAFMETNVGGTHELLKAARKVWLVEGKGGGQFARKIWVTMVAPLPPMFCAIPILAPGTCVAPASPRSCCTTSTIW